MCLCTVSFLIHALSTKTSPLCLGVKYFGLVDDGGKVISFSEWATLAQDRAGWLKLVTKVPSFDIGNPQLRPPRCDTRVTPEEKRRFLARRAQETEQRRALFNAETDAQET